MEKIRAMSPSLNSKIQCLIFDIYSTAKETQIFFTIKLIKNKKNIQVKKYI